MYGYKNILKHSFLILLIFFLFSKAQASVSLNKQKSKLLTNNALEEIDKLNFNRALLLLKRSIILDPGNEKAKELYISVFEITGLSEELKNTAEKIEIKEKNHIPEKIVLGKRPVKQKKQRGKIKKKREGYIVHKPTEKKEVKKNIDLKKDQKREKDITYDLFENTILIMNTGLVSTSRENVLKHFIIGGSVNCLEIESNYIELSYSGISLLGGGFFTEFFLFNDNFSILTDFQSSFFKVSGSDLINVQYHNFELSLKYRKYFFPVYDQYFSCGFKLSYYSFLLDNSEDEGAFNYTSIYGPRAGFFLSDPLIYRLTKKDSFFKNVNFDLSFDIIYYPWDEDHPRVYQTNFKINYFHNDIKYFLGYSQFQMQNYFKDKFQRIEIGVSFNY